MELSPLPVMLWSAKSVVYITPGTHVFTGEHVTLRCDIQGRGQIQRNYSWNKNKISMRGRRDREVTLWSVTQSDSGDYTCRGQSIYSQISDAVTLTVSERPKPVIAINPHNQVFSGDAVTLRCDIQDESVSNWQYSWYKDAAHSPVSSEQLYRISGVKVTHTGNYTCRGAERGGSRTSHFSDALTLTVSGRPRAVLSVSPQSCLTEGDSVTLNCEVTDSSTDWTFSWYREVPYRYGVSQIRINHGSTMYVEPLSDSSRGSGGSYTLSPAALNHTGVYVCRGERGEPAVHTQYSNLQPLWITGEAPPVSLVINPSRTQHFTNDSLSLICKDQSNSTGWTVRKYTQIESVLDCSRGSVTGSTCNIGSLSTFDTGVYWCESESGENSNPVNITVHDANVLLESPVHPVTEGHPLTLYCLSHNTNSSKLQADFYKDGSVLQTQTTGEMIIQTVLKSNEGFYHCKQPKGGESPKSWVSIKHDKTFLGSRSSGGTVGGAVGLGLLFITFLSLLIVMWSYKRTKGKQQKTNQISEQNQRWSGAEDSQSGHTSLQAGTEHMYTAVDQTGTSGTGDASAESSEAIYARVMKKKKTNRNNGADADVIYAVIELKPMKAAKRIKENASAVDDTVYSELKQNME